MTTVKLIENKKLLFAYFEALLENPLNKIVDSEIKTIY